jgi:hypothetical protein
VNVLDAGSAGTVAGTVGCAGDFLHWQHRATVFVVLWWHF